MKPNPELVQKIVSANLAVTALRQELANAEIIIPILEAELKAIQKRAAALRDGYSQAGLISQAIFHVEDLEFERFPIFEAATEFYRAKRVIAVTEKWVSIADYPRSVTRYRRSDGLREGARKHSHWKREPLDVAKAVKVWDAWKAESGNSA